MSLKPVLLIRGIENKRDEIALRDRGIPSISEAFTELTIGSQVEAEKLLSAAREFEGWIVITSRNALPFWAELVTKDSLVKSFKENKKLKFAAIGRGSAESLNEFGVTDILTSNPSNSDELLATLSKYPSSHLFLPLGNLARPTIADGLRALGWQVHSSVVYFTQRVSHIPSAIAAISAGEISAVVLRSPSAARALHSFISHPKIPIICGGPITAKEARELGMNVAGVTSDPTPESVAALVEQELAK